MAEQAKLEDSNLANYGSQEHKDLRKEAAASDVQFKGAGTKAGLEVWRVENRRTENDTPDFGVKRWPQDQYGQFYDGDSYIVLHTYQAKDPETGKLTDRLAWDVHFWLGQNTSQDEKGVAAYKTVELDDLLDDGPVQHREIMGHESKLFQSYFKEIQYLSGGIESGFRKVKPEEYKPRLLQVRRTKKTVRAYEIELKANRMNHGDVFVLDAGLKVYLWVGDEANAFEKSKGANLCHNIVSSRQGKAKQINDTDDEFWKILGGTEDDILPADHPEVERVEAEPEFDVDNCKLFRVSDATGKMEFTKEADGKLRFEMLDSNDVFIVDANIEIFVWIGNGATKQEKNSGMLLADKYIDDSGRPKSVPITQIREGQINPVFRSCFIHA